MKKVFLLSGTFIVGVVVAGVLFVALSWDREHSAPLPDIRASNDSAVIARGKYLAFGPAHCASCHVPMEDIAAVEAGAEIPLSGGIEIAIPLGVFRAPNLTPDPETGIGKMSDAEIARALRFSVGHDGRCLMPFMPFQEMSREDMVAVISCLRSQPPVRHRVEPNEYSVLGRILLAFGLMKPQGPQQPPPQSVLPDSSVEYGRYLAHSVANCVGCHTNRDLQTGEFIGPLFAGGMRFGPDELSQGYVFVSPNLTPDPETGVMAHWSEAQFIARFRSGRVHPGSPMPWGAFAQMKERDLKALYRYLRSLQPVRNSVSQVVYAPGEPLPASD